ncbi:MAG TPA: terminase family protein [Allosphingosinicella sp.]|nr:terminase family protein [Allosphingosinicella sp.]
MADGDELLERLRALAPERRRELLEAAGEAHVKAFDEEWPVWVHPGQLPPHDDWLVWVIMGGRAFGKTRAGAEWVSARARAEPEACIALVAANPDEARRVMVEGRSGLLAVARHGERGATRWEPGLGRLTFASGATAFTYSGADADSLRGPEHHFAWCDELAKWKQAQAAWDNLLLGLRAGDRPQVVVTTTPRPVPAMRAVLAMPGAVTTGGASWDNPHAARAATAAMERIHGGTRLGRQELEGELIEDVQGALWPRELIEKCRVKEGDSRFSHGGGEDGEDGDSHFSRGGGETGRSARESDCPLARDSDCPLVRESDCPRLTRVVIGVDPPGSAGGDACGIVACGLAGNGIGYVLGDHSVAGLSPEGWAHKVAAAAARWGAHRVIAEKNNGGDMVGAVLRGADVGLPVTLVHAAEGKVARAEPVAVLFESGKAKFAGRFPALEDELAGLTYGGGYEGPGRSPDRADAMIWAFTELMVKRQRAEPRLHLL